MDVFVIYLLHSRRRRRRNNQQVADPIQAHGQIIIKKSKFPQIILWRISNQTRRS